MRAAERERGANHENGGKVAFVRVHHRSLHKHHASALVHPAAILLDHGPPPQRKQGRRHACKLLRRLAALVRPSSSTCSHSRPQRRHEPAHTRRQARKHAHARRTHSIARAVICARETLVCRALQNASGPPTRGGGGGGGGNLCGNLPIGRDALGRATEAVRESCVRSDNVRVSARTRTHNPSKRTRPAGCSPPSKDQSRSRCAVGRLRLAPRSSRVPHLCKHCPAMELRLSPSAQPPTLHADSLRVSGYNACCAHRARTCTHSLSCTDTRTRKCACGH